MPGPPFCATAKLVMVGKTATVVVAVSNAPLPAAIKVTVKVPGVLKVTVWLAFMLEAGLPEGKDQTRLVALVEASEKLTVTAPQPVNEPVVEMMAVGLVVVAASV